VLQNEDVCLKYAFDFSVPYSGPEKSTRWIEANAPAF